MMTSKSAHKHQERPSFGKAPYRRPVTVPRMAIKLGAYHRDNDPQLDDQTISTEASEAFFRELSQRWKQDTQVLSSIEEIALHPDYQRIIGMGPRALPYILRELDAEPDQWFWALRAITGDDPVRPAQRGRMREMAQAWLDWATERGIEWQ